MKISVVGCESSGTRWVYHNVILHPQVSHINHWSIPWRDENPVFRIINENIDALILTVRDQSCTKKSMLKGSGWRSLLNNNKLHPDDDKYKVFSKDPIENWKYSANYLINEAKQKNIMIKIISYESLIQFRKFILYNLFKDLNLDPDKYEFYDKNHNNLNLFLPWAGSGNLFPNDGNAKYIQ